jgi:TPR repeat protein
LDNAAPMLRLYVKSRPYFMAACVVLVAWFNLWVHYRSVPWFDVPSETFERCCKVSPDAAAGELLEKAEQKDSLAAYFYALRHTRYCPKDLLIKLDPEVAFKYMTQAAEAERPRAMAVLSLYHLKGIETGKNPEKAKTWAEKAAGHRQPLAHRVLGEIHMLEAESLRGTTLASGSPPTTASLNPTDQLRRASAYAKESRLAEDHLRQAIALGDLGALRILGMAYDDGLIGLIPNHRMAAEHLSRAALRGDAEAAAAMSRRFTAEIQAERDLKLSYAWKLIELRLSRDREKTFAELRMLESRLTVAEKLAAQDQAAQWLALMPSEEDSARARLDPDR